MAGVTLLPKKLRQCSLWLSWVTGRNIFPHNLAKPKLLLQHKFPELMQKQRHSSWHPACIISCKKKKKRRNHNSRDKQLLQMWWLAAATDTYQHIASKLPPHFGIPVFCKTFSTNLRTLPRRPNINTSRLQLYRSCQTLFIRSCYFKTFKWNTSSSPHHDQKHNYKEDKGVERMKTRSRWRNLITQRSNVWRQEIRPYIRPQPTGQIFCTAVLC